MVIQKLIQVKSLYIEIVNNEELSFLKRMIFDRLRYLHSLQCKDKEIMKEIAFLNALKLEISHMEMTK